MSDSNMNCEYHKSPANIQCCCTNKLNKEITCLPSFIVIGSQKSGTTALSGYFLFYQNFLPPRVNTKQKSSIMKEIQFQYFFYLKKNSNIMMYLCFFVFVFFF